jgi:hypothetical protein
LRACEYWALSWFGVCLALSQLIDDASQSGLTVVMFVMLPCVAATGYLMVLHRYTLLTKALPADLNSSEDFELKIRFVMESHVEALSKSSHSENISDETRLKSALDGTFVPSHHLRIIDSLVLVLFSEASQLYSIGCRRFPSSSMYLSRAHS